jgi:hypothetical protein
VRTASRPAPPPPTNSLYSCFGEYSDRALENGENEPQLQRLSNHGSDCATNSSSSYHTPGSPIKQQSESSSSLSRCLLIFYSNPISMSDIQRCDSPRQKLCFVIHNWHFFNKKKLPIEKTVMVDLGDFQPSSNIQREQRSILKFNLRLVVHDK